MVKSTAKSHASCFKRTNFEIWRSRPISAREGDMVAAGAPLFPIDDDPQKADWQFI
jgi:hypothetical protein